MIGKNNPFNVRNNVKNKWLGQIGSRKGFCCFSAEKYGIRAAATCIANYMKFGKVTPRQIINRFAPPSENNTKGYLLFVCVTADLKEDVPIRSDMQFIALLSAISKFEGNFIPELRIYEVLLDFNFKFPDYGSI